MRSKTFETVAEGAFFGVDIACFESTICGYDPRLANQTICCGLSVPAMEATQPNNEPPKPGDARARR